MKTLFNSRDVAALKERLNRLTMDTTPKWGSLSVSQMVCHLHDQLNYALTNRDAVKLLDGPSMFMRHLIRLYLPWPRGARTFKEMLVTETESLERDIEKVSRKMDEFCRATDQEEWAFHPFFGQLNGKAWAKLGWRHMDFHLKQFGV